MKLRFYHSMLMAYVSVIVFVTLVMTLTFYFINRSQTLREIDLINTELLQKSANVMDAAIDQAFRIADRILIDADFREIATDDTLDYYQVTRMVERLNLDSGVFASREFHLGILIPGTDLVLTNEFTVDLSSYLQFSGMDEDSEVIASLTALPSDTPRDVLMIRDTVYRDSDTPSTPVISFIERVRIYRVGTVHLFIHFAKASFFPDRSIKEDGMFALRYRGMEPITTRGAAVSTDGSSVVYSTFSSYLPDLEYLYATDRDMMRRRMSSARLVMAIIALISAAVGTSAAYVWTGRLYRPIRSLVGAFRGQPDTVANELSFIRTEALRLQVRNQHLRHQLDEYAIPLKSKLYRDALLGTSSDHSVALADELSSELRAGAQIALVSIMLPTSIEGELSLRGEQNLRFVISSLIHDEAPRRLRADVVDVDESTIALILKEPYTDSVRDSLHELAATIEQTHKVRLLVVVGDRVGGFAELRISFDRAVSLLHRSPIDERRLVIDRVGITDDRPERFSYPLETERRLIAAAESLDKQKTTELLNSVLDTNYHDKSLSRQSVELLMDMLGGTAHRIAERAGVGIDAAYPVELRGWSEPDAREALAGLYNRLIDSLTESRSRQDEETGRLMVEYVRTHCADDISLLDLAERFKLSPTYVGKAFHRYTGEPFKEFLNLTRVRRAKQLMANDPHVRVKDLASASGFSNTTSFIRMFKRYEGMSPKQYHLRREISE